MTSDFIKDALRSIKYPGFSRDIVSFGLVKEVVCEDGEVSIHLSISTSDPKIPEQIFKECHARLDEVEGIDSVKIDIDVQNPESKGSGASEKSSIPGVKNIIAIASGKGGVGKSTVAGNLAIALRKSGAKVGLCDLDLYGPSMGQMFGSRERPNATEEDMIIPNEAHGIKLMSMSFLMDEKSAVIVRGPLATRYTQQFLQQVEWGELDYLILDLPPGTGDIQLTIAQTVAVDGAVIVTTPQEMALIDARKAVSMFAKVNVNILGVVENMSWFLGDDDKRYYIFGKDGGKREAEKMNVPLLGQIPIEEATRRLSDEGTPVSLQPDAENPIAAAFSNVADQVIDRIHKLNW